MGIGSRVGGAWCLFGKPLAVVANMRDLTCHSAFLLKVTIYYGNVQPMDVLTDHQGSQGHPDRHGHADCHHHHHHTDDCCNQHEPHSIASLPDRLACEEMANAMTAMVLNDEKGKA